MNEAETNQNPRPRRFIRLMRGGLLVLAGGILLAWGLGAFRREPLHKGKPISYWVDQACLDLDRADTWERRREVKSIGEPAVPYLVKKLQRTDRGRPTWNSLRTRLPKSWQERFPAKRPAKEIHYGAARTLELLGPAAKPAIPDLVRLLPEIPYPALNALIAIGTNAAPALPALHGMLTDSNITLRVEVARALWVIGRETNEVLNICTNAIQSVLDCQNAPALLIELKTAAAPAVPVVLAVLRDPNRPTGVRVNSAITLGVARVDRLDIRAALLDGATEGQDGGLRVSCMLALWGLDPKYAPPATRMLMEEIVRLRALHPKVDQDFISWLEHRDLDPRESVPTLKELLRSDPPELRKEAALTLERISAKFGPVK